MENEECSFCHICNSNYTDDSFIEHLFDRHSITAFVLYSSMVPEPTPLEIIDDYEYDIRYIDFSIFEIDDDEFKDCYISIESISTIKDKTELQKDDICAICLDSFLDKPIICSMDVCKHNYCKECIERWVSISSKCPLCKGELW